MQEIQSLSLLATSNDVGVFVAQQRLKIKAAAAAAHPIYGEQYHAALERAIAGLRTGAAQLAHQMLTAFSAMAARLARPLQALAALPLPRPRRQFRVKKIRQRP